MPSGPPSTPRRPTPCRMTSRPRHGPPTPRWPTPCGSSARRAFDSTLQGSAEPGVPIVALTHRNKDGEALGRRITERARSVLSLTCPDPDGQPDRRRFWVSKSATKKPPPLGITIKEEGNE